MTRKEMQSMFIKLRECTRITDSQSRYSAKDWRQCVDLWLSIFRGDDPMHFAAAVNRYIHEGGVFWPYPGEIADLMPSDDSCATLKEIGDLRYTSRKDARELQAIINKRR